MKYYQFADNSCIQVRVYKYWDYSKKLKAIQERGPITSTWNVISFKNHLAKYFCFKIIDKP